jgi:hypothetical protein
MQQHLNWKKSTKDSEKLKGVHPDVVDHRLACIEKIISLLKQQHPQMKLFRQNPRM